MPAKKLIDGFEAAKHPLYATWANMKTRCSNKKSKNFDIYGGKGVRVCERWIKFENFAADMGPKPSVKHTLDRIDSNGNYEPTNCRWADSVTQGRNTSRVVLIEFNGQKKCLPEWAAFLKISKPTLKSRIKHGWSVEKALSTPANSYSKRI